MANTTEELKYQSFKPINTTNEGCDSQNAHIFKPSKINTMKTEKTYTAVITGQQQHITGSTHEHITEAQLAEILNRYLDENYPNPQPDGNSYELNNDRYITITEG